MRSATAPSPSTDVAAYSCNEAVVAACDTDMAPELRGWFTDATVAGVRVVAGEYAQLDSTTMLWTVGQSLMPIYVAAGLTWTPHISDVTSSGPFTH